ncbi:S8 family peptidase [Ferrovibrio xuzhouensis]|uniref:S8 family peptidase n=1 Tax=Ferrovibrio xuzhouensis TaxID=1576914 RepID=A0ABV7VFF9_9PROT
MTGALQEDQWESLGLTLLSSDEDRTLVLFSTTEDMQGFRERLAAYAGGPRANHKSAPYAGFLSNIEEIGDVRPQDRIGIRLREDGVTNPADFQDATSYLLDVELWELGGRQARSQKADQIAEYIEAMNGQVFDRYVGPSITMVRARVGGALARTLLNIEDVSNIDRPPQPDFSTADILDATLPELPELTQASENLPVIGVIDSGVNAHPLIDDIVVGSIAIPARLGIADGHGHGTRTAGFAVFGDLRGQFAAGTMTRYARIASAKVLDDTGNFDEMRLVPKQMREALTELSQSYGCRVFVISLADTHQRHQGAKVGAWAATLDELARELNAVIIVAAGNRQPRPQARLEETITAYPGYLTEPRNRLCEPAGGLNLISVGSLSHGSGIGPEDIENAHLRAVTAANEPSPFTAIGPGVGGATKPDLVDIGGTFVFDAVAARLRRGADYPSAGIVTLHNSPRTRLFASSSGTSCAAPIVANKAARILARFPNASANLVRALLVGSAHIPDEAALRLQPLGDVNTRLICGNGVADPERASYSDDDRVILYAEDNLQIDHFAVYHVPVPPEFQTGGKRSIRVSLAFDPPVRHTRFDYAGVGMSFRLLRGCSSDLIFEHYRSRTQADGPVPAILGRYDCKLQPGSREREKNSVQTAAITFTNDTTEYGNDYYLVVRCEGGWAAGTEASQNFALLVEMAHQPATQLYARLRARIRV